MITPSSRPSFGTMASRRTIPGLVGVCAAALVVLAFSGVALADEPTGASPGSAIPEALMSTGVLVPSIVGAVVVGIVLIRSVSGVMRTSARERTRREIAAYIAEGSMSPEQGERLMKAGKFDA